jgi:ArsR family transcriptional regulator
MARPPRTGASCCPPEVPRTPRVRPDDPAADTQLAAFTKALGHPTRVRILRLLAARHARMCSHIVDELPLAQSTVSEHLRILRAAGLVRTNEDGPRAGYCIVPSALRRLKQLLGDL